MKREKFPFASLTVLVGPRKHYVVAAVDILGDRQEHDVAVALRRVERELEDHETVEEAVLTLATADEPSLDFPPPEGSAASRAVRRCVHSGRWLQARP